MDGQKYSDLVRSVYELILKEMEFYKNHPRQEMVKSMYPKFILMYEFLRMLRGEAFTEIRPSTDSQKDFYAMENNIRVKLEEIRSHINPDDEYVQLKIKEMQKNFIL